MVKVITERLCIQAQSLDEMKAIYEHETEPMMKQAYSEMLESAGKLPGREQWGTLWKIRLHNGECVGSLCFMGAPDAEGKVELGYGIDDEYCGSGYATEAVGGIVKWAFAQGGVERVTAQTDTDNVPSQRVLLKNGFVQSGFGDEGLLFIKKENKD